MWEKESMNKPILDYLEQYHKDELDKAKLDKEKSAKKLMQYIFSKARQEIKENAGMIEDDIVFGWAIHYLVEDNEIINNEKLPELKTNEAKISKVETKETSKPKEIKKDDENQVSLFDFL